MNLRLPTPVRLLLVTATALLSLLSLNAPAHAAIYAAGGNWGPYTQADATCRSRIYGTSKVVDISVPTPRVFANNAHYGSNNDWAWVRVRAFVVNASTGAVVTSSGYSSWSYATDVTPASWSGVTTFSMNGNGNYRVDHRIEYWNSSVQVGWVADRINRFRLINTYGAGIGTFGSCSYVA
jgi:hypothetical protein